MGCASSKLDDLPAVQLCRDRLHNLSQALQHRDALSQAHIAYIHSLISMGGSLHRFFDNPGSIPSPSISISEYGKNGENMEEEEKTHQQKTLKEKKSSGELSSDEDSGSHLHFHSDSEEEDGEEDEIHHGNHDHASGSEPGSGRIPHNYEMNGKFNSGGMMMYEEGSGFGGGGFGPGSGSGYDYNPYLYSSNGYGGGGGGGGTMHMNYMKKHVTPSVSYEQRPMSYETQTVQFGDPSNSNYYDYFGGGGGGYFGPVPGPRRGGYYGPPVGVQPMRQQQQAPPPPPPPAASGWDFMNFFESLDNHYSHYRPPSSRDSREVREEEGIPELEEEEEDTHEVVKEVHGHQKLVAEESGESSISGGGEGKGKGGGSEVKRVGEVEEEVVGVGVSEVESGNVYTGRPSVSIESAPVEYEVRMVDKKVVGEEGKGGGGGVGVGRPGFRNVFEVVKEIQVQFERAANYGSEIGNVLEVGKFRYQRKNAAFQGLKIGNFLI